MRLFRRSSAAEDAPDSLRPRSENARDHWYETDPRDEIVLAEARRAIDQQVRDLDGLRSRAGTLASYAVAVCAFLAGLSLRNNASLTCWTWTGFGFLALVVGCAVFILRPRTFTFTLKPKDMDDDISDNAPSVSFVLRSTSNGLAQEKRNNQTKLDRLHSAYLLGLILLVLEALALLTDLAKR